MSYNLNLLVSDIPANLEIPLSKGDYFNTGNIAVLEKKLTEKLDSPFAANKNERIITKYYNWEDIALNTFNLYRTILNTGVAPKPS